MAASGGSGVEGQMSDQSNETQMLEAEIKSLRAQLNANCIQRDGLWMQLVEAWNTIRELRSALEAMREVK